MVYAQMGKRGLNFQPVPLLLKSRHPIADALRTVAPTGMRRDIVAALDGRVSYDTVRNWLYGRTHAPAWVYDTLSSQLTALNARLAAAPRAITHDEKAALMSRSIRAYRIKRARKLDELRKEKGAD
jgi:hypothetical protein